MTSSMLANSLDRDGHRLGWADRTPRSSAMTAQRAAAAAAMRHAPRPRPANPARVMCKTETGHWRAAEGRNPGRPTERTLDPPSLRPLARFHRSQRAIRPTREALGSEQLRQQLLVRICMGLEDPKDADLIFASGAARHGWDPQLLDAPGKFFLRAPNQGLAMPKLARAFFVADELAHQLAATYAHQATPLDTLSQQAADRSTRPRPCAAAHSSVTDRDRPPERSSPVADPLTQAPTYLAPLVADRQRRGTHTAPEHLEAAAALLVDLWAAAARHGITPDHHVWSFHLPRAALDTITAARKRRHADRARAGR